MNAFDEILRRNPEGIGFLFPRGEESVLPPVVVSAVPDDCEVHDLLQLKADHFLRCFQSSKITTQ